MGKPLAVDLFCGLGGWTDGLLAEGWDVVGFDIERHAYGSEKYPAQLVIQDVLTIHGSQFKGVDLIVASPPCQEYSYMAMPWSRAKAIAADYRSGVRDVKKLTALFDACFRIQREASEAAGRHIPMVVENVRGAQPWVGRARANYGSFYLWGDVPILLPKPQKRGMKGSVGTINGSGKHREQSSWDRGDALKVPGFRFDGSGGSFQTASVEAQKANPDGTAHGTGSWFKIADSKNRGASERATKNEGGSWFAVANNTTSGHSKNPVHDAVKRGDADGYERNHPAAFGWKKPKTGSKSSARIAKIPTRLARFIASYYYPEQQERTA